MWSVETHELTCGITGLHHVVWVGFPTRYERLANRDFPLVLCLDGAWTFGTALDSCRIMALSREAPEAVVAGVAFVVDDMETYLQHRARFLTPTQWVPPEFTGVRGVIVDETGRAADYLAFLERQVLPLLADRYRIGERTLLGHSFSGLFGLRTMLLRPELFDRYLLASPSIWWDGRAILDVEEQVAAERDDLAAAVFLSAGSRETRGMPEDMLTNVALCADRLEGRGYPSLRVDRAVLDGDDHSSSIGAAISKGLRSLFA